MELGSTGKLQEVSNLYQDNDTIPYAKWWTKMGQCKNLVGWNKKLKDLEYDGEEGTSTKHIGLILFQHLTDNGTMCSEEIQEPIELQ